MKIINRHSTLTSGTAGLIISLMTYSETAVPIKIGSISLYSQDCLFGEARTRRRKQSGSRLLNCVTANTSRHMRSNKRERKREMIYEREVHKLLLYAKQIILTNA